MLNHISKFIGGVIKIIEFSFYILLFLFAFRFDGKIFYVAIKSACVLRKKGGKTPRQIYYVSYYEWALKIIKIK